MRKQVFIICTLLLASAHFVNGAEPVAPTDVTNQTKDRATVIIVVGAAGDAEYGKSFTNWSGLWNKACETAGARQVTIGLGPTNEATDLEWLKRALSVEPSNGSSELWVVLVGHGTFDGRDAKFNLRGPDLSASELATELKPFRRPVAVIDCTSSSSPFLNKLSAPGRVVVTATRSGHEENYARFGGFLAAAITDPEADLDKDGQTSLLEAFIMASRRTEEFYEADGRLATEHALLDDNGDGLGTPASWFRGVRATKKPAGGAEVDGIRAHQFNLVRSAEELQLTPEARVRRDELEFSLSHLRESKPSLGEDEYYRRLEKLLVELARLYEGQPKSDVR